MSLSQSNLLSQLPAVEALLHDAEAEGWAVGVPRRILVESVREAVENARQRLLELVQDASDSGVSNNACGGGPKSSSRSPLATDSEAFRQTILTDVRKRVDAATLPHYRKVINATGIILHTALGRAVLPAKAIRQIEAQLSGYSLLQADIGSGERSKRDERVESLLLQLTGAEAATVVNNNSAATSIVLNTVARGKEVIVSRGQLVEIGGSFRLPDVMAASGAQLVEVGTTNKTHARDYVNAITPNTAAILRVHPSNYKITGFTSETPLDALVRIAHDHGILMIDDVGAGPLIDFSRFGFEKEPTLQESVQNGADLITSSADKLIGGSQGGIILGRAPLLQAIRKNPFARIVRVGKLTLAALEATLSLFLDEAMALSEVPTLRMLCRKSSDIAAQAERITQAIRDRVASAAVTVTEGFSQMGSGSLPTQNLATRLIAIEPKTIDSGELARRLRCSEPPVFARIHKGELLIDPRTLLEGDEPLLIEAVVQSLQPVVQAV
jgi:L-seryl-tRNA(Ser) seleniumtransferase